MSKRLLLLILVFLIKHSSYSQTAFEVHTFPEDYAGKTITFKNTRFWPVFHESGGYYAIWLDVAEIEEERSWGFDDFHKIICVVNKRMAKNMINEGIDDDHFYYGEVTGKIIKSDAFVGSDYLFILKKIINHPPFQPDIIVHKFE